MKRLTENDRMNALHQWYKSDYSKKLDEMVWDIIKAYLKRLPISNFVPIGLPLNSEKPFNISMGQQISLVSEQSHLKLDDLAAQDYLPLESDSKSCLVYFHLLDVLNSPYQMLREANRVLDDSGYLIVVGFNPYSLYGLCRSLSYPLNSLTQTVPWSLKSYSHKRLNSWLRVLEFIPCDMQSVGVVPPLLGQYSEKALELVQPKVSRYTTMGGMVQISLYRKNLAPVTPIQSRWRASSDKIYKGKLNTQNQTRLKK